MKIKKLQKLKNVKIERKNNKIYIFCLKPYVKNDIFEKKIF